jgi:hypothetical protein
MATIPQIQRGLTLFIDNEVACSFTGWQKAVIGGVGGLVAANIPKIIEKYHTHPLVDVCGIFDASNNTINMDALYNAIVPKLGAEKIPVEIPKIGVIKLGRDEFDALMRYIREG